MSFGPAPTTVDASAAASRDPRIDNDGGIAYNFSTSLIVRTAVAAGIIVLVLTALVLFFNVSPVSADLSWDRRPEVTREDPPDPA